MLGYPYRKYCNHLNQIKSGLNGCNIFKPFEVFQYKLFKPAPDCLESNLHRSAFTTRRGLIETTKITSLLLWNSQYGSYSAVQFKLYSIILNYTQFF